MSDGSDSLVQERPAWVIPAIVAAGVFLFSAAFAYYYFGPTPSEILGLDPRASESQDKVEMTIGDRHFLVPANFTRYPLQRVGGTQNEIDLHALLPELAPYSTNRKQEFEDNSSSSSLVHIKIHLAGDLLPAARRLDDIYARHLASQTPQQGPSGLEMYEFSQTSGYRDQQLFVAEQPNDQPVLILCFRETDIIFSPNCTRTLSLTEEVAVTYRYKRALLEAWASTDRSILARVESFVVEDATDDLREQDENLQVGDDSAGAVQTAP